MKLSKLKLIAALLRNRNSAKKYGWTPEWFGAKDFDEDLITKVQTWQVSAGLTPDGLVGPMTFTRKQTEREAQLDIFTETNFIYCNGKTVPIKWSKVVNLVDKDNLALPATCYKKVTKDRKPHMLVVHWDAALSAESCYNILKKKNISTHFCIDNDGTIYQMVDCNNVAWHCNKLNSVSVGIDFSNAFYTKYQSWYTKRGFGKRPLISNSKLHGRKIEEHLGYYPIQEEAFKALVDTLSDYYKIDLKVPKDEQSKLLLKVDPLVANGTFKGVCCHYHYTDNKMDCSGLELDRLVEEVELGE